MTREEEIQKAAVEYAEPTKAYLFGEETGLIKDAFVRGAKYADKHPAKKQAVTLDGYLYRYPNGTLSLFRDNLADFMTDLNEDDFPKVTHENSPKKVKVTIELEDEL